MTMPSLEDLNNTSQPPAKLNLSPLRLIIIGILMIVATVSMIVIEDKGFPVMLGFFMVAQLVLLSGFPPAIRRKIIPIALVAMTALMTLVILVW